VEPTADEVRQQLDRVLASDGFTNADRMSGFLRYVVDRALAGESDRIKEYVIGVEVFGRNQEYDPRLDSIVRVEARRLRTKVDEYYAGPGNQDEVIIRIRRGSYVPTFERRATEIPVPAPAAAPARPSARPNHTLRMTLGLIAATAILVSLAAWRANFLTGSAASQVSVAVLPFKQYSTDPADRLLAARLTDGVTIELARTRTVSVVSRTSADQTAIVGKPLREIAQTLNAMMVMEGTITRDGDNLRVVGIIVNGKTDRKVWVEDFAGTTDKLPDLQRRIATSALAAIRRNAEF
jgi:TolB-like protein